LTGVQARRGEFGHGWPIILGGLIGMAVHAFAFFSLGTVLTPLAAATGWSRTQILAVAPFGAIMAPFVAPMIGTLVERHGARRVALAGFAMSGIATALLGAIGDGIWAWWLLWVVIGLATFPTGALVWTQLVTRGFERRRGLALGLVLSGMGVAVAVVPLFMAWAVAGFGWRTAYVMLGAAMLSLGVVATLLATSQQPLAATAGHDPAAASSGWTRGEALRSWRFWQLGLILLLSSAAVGVMALHLQPMMIDRGMTMLTAATLAAAFGPAQIVGRLAGGFLLDRIHGGLLGAIVFAAPLLGCAMLLGGIDLGAALWLVPILFGVAAGLELDLGSYVASRYFGTAHFAAIFSGLFVFHVVGYALAPLAAAYARDLSGGYTPVLIAIAAILPIVVALCATLGRYPDTGRAE
jgi:predicted MFS family arabinose efflux permease